jgi:hypothetical protein
VIALFAALGGTGYAASRVISPQASASKVSKGVKKYVKKQVRSALTADATSDSTASVKHASTADTATTATQATTAGNAFLANNATHATNADRATKADTAGKVDQLQEVGTYKNITATHGASETAARTAAPEVPLFKFGALDVYAKCFTDDSGPTTHLQVYMRTTQAGSIKEQNGSASDLNGGAKGYLNPSTPEEDTSMNIDRILTDLNTATNSVNTSSSSSGDFWGTAPDGSGISGYFGRAVKNGTLAAGDGVYGSGDHCIVTGFATG